MTPLKKQYLIRELFVFLLLINYVLVGCIVILTKLRMFEEWIALLFVVFCSVYAWLVINVIYDQTIKIYKLENEKTN